MTKLGIYLKEKREKENSSKKEQAKELKINYTELSRLETGSRKLTEKRFKGIVNVYGKDKKEIKKLYLTQITDRQIKDTEFIISKIKNGADIPFEDIACKIIYGI